ncbi:hypothetical protein B0H13DRAFT_2149653, partial [Mycena leptocephala]
DGIFALFLSPANFALSTTTHSGASCTFRVGFIANLFHSIEYPASSNLLGRTVPLPQGNIRPCSTLVQLFNSV